jgi:heptosyltransferase-2
MRAAKFNKTFTLPFGFEIPNNSLLFMKKNSSILLRIKFIKRYFFMKFKNQLNLELDEILSHHQDILWINISAPSLGDSLMDLSSRVLLAERKIDLFTDKYNAKLYENDSIFSHVYTEIEELLVKKYDLVIIDSYSTRSIAIKNKIAANVEFVGMFGYYNGPEVNRVLFSFHRMCHLLKDNRNEVEIRKIAKPLLNITLEDSKYIHNLNLPIDYITIVVGGEWDFRIFRNWHLVIREILQKDNDQKIILIGSLNGKKIAKQIMREFSNNNILNYTSELTFNQTAEIMKHAMFSICCDGGLMHASNAVDATSVVLLAKLNQDMQLTEANRCLYLYDSYDVNNIKVEKILDMCDKAVNLVKY